jgi:hypothetical protein
MKFRGLSKSSIFLNSLEKSSIHGPIVCGKNNFLDISRINMELPLIFEEKSSIPTCIEKKELITCCN